MNWLIRLLKTFEYDTLADFGRSLAPSFKYQLVFTWLSLAGISSFVQRIFGLDALALMAFVAIVLVELISGIKASRIKKETFSSMRLSRFTLKMACYLILIALPFLLSQSFTAQGKTWAAAIFDWLHTFLIIHIAFENIISVLENLSVIEGKDKTFYIEKIRSYLQSKLTP